jgi:predicted metal-dependent hydrolase
VALFQNGASIELADDVVRRTIVNTLSWFKRRRETFVAQARQSALAMVAGETHHDFGRAWRLRVVEHDVTVRIGTPRKGELVVHAHRGLTSEQREPALHAWYRDQLKEPVPELLAKRERLLGVKTVEVGIESMKTRWGTCNMRARRTWLNLELEKYPRCCLEYIVAHELALLVQRTHGARFVALLDRQMPRRQSLRAELNAAPLADEERKASFNGRWPLTTTAARQCRFRAHERPAPAIVASADDARRNSKGAT